MNRMNVLVGIFVTLGVALIAGALFLIGNQHKAFRRHTIFYTTFQNVDGISKGAKVKVEGMDGGQVQDLTIPSSPSQPFHLKMSLEDRLHGLIREDSFVTIETEGIVGDKFLLIHKGTDHTAEARAESTLHSKEPLQLDKLLEQAQGIMQQAQGAINVADSTMIDVRGHLDTALNSVTTAVHNANGMINDVRSGKGAAGVLLENQATASDIQQIVRNARDVTTKLDASSAQIDDILGDVQRRQLVAKMDDTLNNTKGATQQLDQTSQQLNTTLRSAFAEDQYGENAGSNLQQSLTNINAATGNLADDTEALKHQFFFKGFFKHRGYYNLDDLPAEPYRSNKIFKSASETREWLAADALFTQAQDGSEILSPGGRQQIDQAVSRAGEIYSSPWIVEGYSNSGTDTEQLIKSRNRAMIVRTYLQLRFRIVPKNTGVVGLEGMPPMKSGKSNWNGVCLVVLRHEH